MSERVDVVRLRELLNGVREYGSGEWWIGPEHRNRSLAIKRGIYTPVSVGKYYDAGRDSHHAALYLITAVLNAAPALLARLDALEEVAEAADMVHAHGPGAPTRQPDSCPLCAALARLREGKA